MKLIDVISEPLPDRGISADQVSDRLFDRMLNAIVYEKAGSNAQVFVVIMATAFLIIALRIFAPFEIGKDEGLQLQAAHRLVEGQGLTITHTILQPADIAESPTPIYLTWWPPALSLIVAGFLSTGMPLVGSLKIIYAITTLIGWTGWAIIACHLLSGPVRLKGRAYHIQVLIAALIPVFYTPIWDGTDIFLWAGVPFIVLLCFNAGTRQSYTCVMAAGLLLGFLYAARYASLFAFVAAVLILLQVSFPNFRALLKRAVVLSMSALVLILPTVLYIRLFSQHGSFLPAYVKLSEHAPEIGTGGGSMLHLIENSAKSLVFTSSMILANPLPARVIYYIIGSRLLIYAAGIVCSLIIFSLPLIVLRNQSRESEKPQTGIALSISFLPLSLTAFFLVSTFALRWSPLGVERYYEPVIFCCPLLFYRLAASQTAHRFIRLASGALVALFVLYNCGYVTAQAFSNEKRRDLVRTVLGYTPAQSSGGPSTSYPISYPDFTIYSRKENSRQQVKSLYEAKPEAIFYVLENYQYYVYDDFQNGGPRPGTSLRYFPPIRFWEQAYSSKPVRIYWVLDDRSASMDVSNLAFIPDSNLKTIFLDQFERTRILVSDFPAGYRFFNNQSVLKTQSSDE